MNFQETGCSPLELSFLVFVTENFLVALFVKVLQIFILCVCDNLVICKHQAVGTYFSLSITPGLMCLFSFCKLFSSERLYRVGEYELLHIVLNLTSITSKNLLSPGPLFIHTHPHIYIIILADNYQLPHPVRKLRVKCIPLIGPASYAGDQQHKVTNYNCDLRKGIKLGCSKL